MISRLHKGDAETGERTSEQTGSSQVIPIGDARRAAAGRGVSFPAPLEQQLEEVQEYLDRGLPSAAEARLRQIITHAKRDHSVLARARRLHSVTLESLGRFRDSLEAVRVYEAPESGKSLDSETFVSVRVQLAMAYNYMADHPKAIALLQSELRAVTERGGGSDELLGNIYTSLARVYRSINEYSIARDHNNKALDYFRRAGGWRGMADCYFGLGMADAHEGLYEKTLENFEQAIQLIGDRPAPFVLARIYSNAAAAYWWLKRPHEGIRALEKAISYNEHTEHKETAASAYNNLGVHLTLVGEWDRAQTALTRALELSLEMDEHQGIAAIAFDSLGELRMLRGDMKEARDYLEKAVEHGKTSGKRWYASQTMRTLTRCYVSLGLTDEALAQGGEVLALAERIGDHRGISDARLLLAEAHLLRGEAEECSELLARVSDESDATTADLFISGETQRLQGLLALSQDDASRAVHHFGRSLSIFEMMGDRYRTARAHFLLGRAYASTAQRDHAGEHLGLAAHTFRELGAKLDMKLADDFIEEFESSAPSEHTEPPAPAQLLTLRLAEAVTSRELLLRELAAVVHQETRALRVLISETDEESHPRAVVSHGFSAEEAARLSSSLEPLKTEEERESFADAEDATLITLHPVNAPRATLFVSPRALSTLPGGSSLEPLLRVVELGMDVCALRARAKTGAGAQAQDSLAGASLMPGFIHSSPAMTRLVDEVHKIRSSDVTVLVTGESGTGKELVARAIHALSSRRNKVFVPFNCTAVPKELSEGYLFGYRRGSFTGAVSDSPGVIRTAAGGTLFLDEIGDLPLDVQPKLLRFLQEGEIQPLGEQRPVKVDVRIIAATNTDLEAMVADGRFREDLYYRLNVIRLRVPPLRERRSEIPAIVNYYVNHYSAKFGRLDITFTPQTVDLLMVFDWPGNVRELTNEVQRIVARAEDGAIINPEHLSPELRRTSAPTTSTQFTQTPGLAASAAAGAISQGLTLADAMAELERRMIAEALRKHNGNISRAARELGLTRRGLYLKLGRHDLSASA
ncbi:MAG TPA: sigma 54-interacting transcriptional regulator [Pyrinomonadaceae bacterium]|jgi:DNA-binding NtrC family response regulator/tetratricopeptide (TPR) repeat protein|nr:sigma 54-interacting transcriptional regulator [Pyrinomonadaceae bacterium]